MRTLRERREAARTARAEVSAIIADAERRAADYWTTSGIDFEAEADAFEPALRAEAAGSEYFREAS